MFNFRVSVTEEFAIAADHVYDGAAGRDDSAVVIRGSYISRVLRRDELPAGFSVCALPQGAWLAPGFIDTQVNGGGDVLFNDDPNPRGTSRRSRRRIAGSERRHCYQP